MTIQLSTLPNGLRILTDRVDTIDSVALGAYFGVGTRNEDMTENGLAHLVEHMMYKGTPTRSAREIAEEIEGIGGHMNAYTSREVTGYYFHVLKDDVRKTLDVLADMLLRSTFDPGELERERQVILQEIGMNADTPDDLIYDFFQERAYPNQTLGAPILGRADIVANMPRDAIVRYVRSHYTASNMVLSAAGNVDHANFVAQATELFGALPESTVQHYAPAAYQGGEHRTEKELEQAHILLGFHGISRTDPRYYQAVALAHILGGGMSSRLFQEVREKRGLAYNIYAFHSAYRDDGTFGIYAGTDPARVGELMSTLVDNLNAFPGSVLPHEIDRTKSQLKSSLLMGRESMTTRADQNAKHLIFHGRVLNTEDMRTRIDQISVGAVTDLARTIFASPPILTGLGPLSEFVPYSVLREKITVKSA